MFASIAGVALALQLGGPAYPLNEGNPPIQEIQYYRYGRPPPCGHGYDVDSRDGMCYPNGMVPPQFQPGRYYPLEYGGGRRPIPLRSWRRRRYSRWAMLSDGHSAAALSAGPPRLSLPSKRLLRDAVASTGRPLKCFMAFSSEVGTGSREENASKQKSGVSVLIQSERKR